jgi:hypothetical protein
MKYRAKRIKRKETKEKSCLNPFSFDLLAKN